MLGCRGVWLVAPSVWWVHAADPSTSAATHRAGRRGTRAYYRSRLMLRCTPRIVGGAVGIVKSTGGQAVAEARPAQNRLFFLRLSLCGA